MKIEDLHSLLGKYIVLDPDGTIFGRITSVNIVDGNILQLKRQYEEHPMQLLLINNNEVEDIVFITEYLWQANLYKYERYGEKTYNYGGNEDEK